MCSCASVYKSFVMQSRARGRMSDGGWGGVITGGTCSRRGGTKKEGEAPRKAAAVVIDPFRRIPSWSVLHQRGCHKVLFWVFFLFLIANVDFSPIKTFSRGSVTLGARGFQTLSKHDIFTVGGGGRDSTPCKYPVGSSSRPLDSRGVTRADSEQAAAGLMY